MSERDTRYGISGKKRKSIRLFGYDYSQVGWYFVTICTKGKREWFGKCEDGKIRLNVIGKAVDMCWKAIPEHFLHVELDEYIIMPNHVHGIIVINENPNNLVEQNTVGAQNFEPLHMNEYQHMIPKSLGSIVRGFKIGVTKFCRSNKYESFQWQRSYYDRIIRNDEELANIRAYIYTNPQNWKLDEYYLA